MSLSLLITDDETLERDGLARQLNWSDYSITEVFTAKDGPSALEILRNKNIDILFSDIKMPIMSGIELAQHARQIHPALQIVFISGYDDFMYAKAAIQVNVHEYILKPVCSKELAACVTNLTEKILKQKEEQKNVIWNVVDLMDGERKSMQTAAVEKVISYVEANYKDNISLEKIAKEIYYSPNYLGNAFKQETNQNFSRYLMEYRIRQAAQLLLDRNVKILDASMSVGYKNMSSFIKNFKSVFGVTPSEYRKYT